MPTFYLYTLDMLYTKPVYYGLIAITITQMNFTRCTASAVQRAIFKSSTP